MDAFSLVRHLSDVHDPPFDPYTLGSLDANAAHYRLHGPDSDHQHTWAGHVADPQGPIQERRR